ncbi:hypothetical protein JVX91_11865 [Pseudomonas sp. PDNC002]|uniref:hypothetical protein n=1 Tax=Pseudomonas sp. PDNC002 TaxID=2811422 RepID=UPI0019631932|nr:hypothetical protein [Pseudomonas sp. PDNC002]QRY81756.1 hypothetical protein JVX91_11865 [Pseudomonas sp. PDNC002]
MNRRGWLAILAGLVFAGSSLAAESLLERQRSTDAFHGLYEIDQAARAFVAIENARNQTDWVVTEPNLKILVTRCSVPLTTRWRAIRLFAQNGREITRQVVEVSCARPVSGERWSVPLRVFHPS